MEQDAIEELAAKAAAEMSDYAIPEDAIAAAIRDALREPLAALKEMMIREGCLCRRCEGFRDTLAKWGTK